MITIRELRVAGLVVVGLVVLLMLARWNGERAGEEQANARVQRERIRTLAAAVTRDRARILELTAAARATDAPHEAAKAATDRQHSAARKEVATARAAAASDTLTLEEAKEELVVLSDRIDAMAAAHALERTTGSRRIEAYQVVVTHVELAAPRVDSLVSAQAERIRTIERGRPWYRRLLGATCKVTTTGGGAGIGASVGGPPGAVGGAVLGLAVGALACR